jgi:hypothetical protein
MSRWRSGYAFILILIILIFTFGCRGNVSGEKVLFDFESGEELDRLNWSCHTVYSLSEQHYSNGLKSLKLELYPSDDYPGLSVTLKEKDWRGFRKFCFDIYNPESGNIQLSVRIDDLKKHPEYADRYNQKIILTPGDNKVCIHLDSLITSGTKRPMNLRTIYRFLIFQRHPQEKTVLYVDYLRLEE